MYGTDALQQRQHHRAVLKADVVRDLFAFALVRHQLCRNAVLDHRLPVGRHGVFCHGSEGAGVFAVPLGRIRTDKTVTELDMADLIADRDHLADAFMTEQRRERHHALFLCDRAMDDLHIRTVAEAAGMDADEALVILRLRHGNIASQFYPARLDRDNAAHVFAHLYLLLRLSGLPCRP